MTIEELQLKLYERLKPSGWGFKLRMFILSQEFAAILTELYNDSRTGKNFTPILKDIFRAFEECPYDKLKVVIIGLDPYSEVSVADGIAFSCSYTKKEQSALRYIFDEIERTVYKPQYAGFSPIDRVNYDPDLKRWSNQGVLMLNTALTCQINKIGSHIELWRPFIIHLMDVLSSYNTGMIYVFLGQKVKDWHTYVSPNNYKFFCTHPSSAEYMKPKNWDSGDVFNQINKVLTNMNGEKILW